jgi:hypothetical protein
MQQVCILKCSRSIIELNKKMPHNCGLEDKESAVTFDRHLPLDERILRIDHIQARRYSKLTGVALEIATQGIIRHLRACDRMDVNPDTSAVREIIDDALNGRRVFAETGEQIQAA